MICPLPLAGRRGCRISKVCCALTKMSEVFKEQPARFEVDLSGVTFKVAVVARQLCAALRAQNNASVCRTTQTEANTYCAGSCSLQGGDAHKQAVNVRTTS